MAPQPPLAAMRPPATLPGPTQPPKRYVYKVVEKRVKGIFSGRRINAGDIENMINEWAPHGWILDRIVSGETAAFMGLGEKDVFLLIFRQECQ